VQWLRGLAALLVVVFHTKSNALGPPAGLNFLYYGEKGVDLFFVISGFIMTVTTASNPSPREFVKKRLIRIVPLYWIVTLAYAAIDMAFPQFLRSGSHDPAHIVSSLLFVPAYHPRFPDHIWPIVIPGWSLNYEMFFYAIFAAALAISPRHRAILTVGGLLIGVLVGRATAPAGAIFATYTNSLLLEFIFGIAVGHVFLGGSRINLPKLISGLSVLVAVIVVFSFAGGALPRFLTYGSIGALLLALLVYVERRGIRFANRVALALGDASYSIYLTHFAVVAGVRLVGMYFGIDWSNWVSAVGGLLLALAVSSLVGWASYQAIERPMMRRLRGQNATFGVGHGPWNDRHAPRVAKPITAPLDQQAPRRDLGTVATIASAGERRDGQEVSWSTHESPKT
jgi:exopolysaccharide production protein ExoZ